MISLIGRLTPRSAQRGLLLQFRLNDFIYLVGFVGRMRFRYPVVGILIAAVAVVVLMFAFWRGSQDPVAVGNRDQQDGVAVQGGQQTAGDGSGVVIGGVRRMPTDVAADGDSKDDDGQDTADSLSYGKLPGVAIDANPQVAAVAAAIKEQRNPEQVSSLVRPRPFDPAAFQADPQKYLDTVEPGRVFAVLQPGADAPAIRRVSRRYQQINQGEVVAVQVAAPVGAPVTFTSFDAGQFENQLTSITVIADEDGVATARFSGTSGTISDVNILAGSPLAAGNVSFVVDVAVRR